MMGATKLIRHVGAGQTGSGMGGRISRADHAPSYKLREILFEKNTNDPPHPSALPMQQRAVETPTTRRSWVEKEVTNQRYL